MDQQGVTPANGIQTIDRLRYNYGNNEESNRLARVADNATNYGLGDFVENAVSNGTGDDYSYDKNGNLATDYNKGIEKITYTHFNKPDRVLFTNGKSIEFSYDAAGSKVQELIKEPGKPDKVTDYIGGYVYEGNVMRYIQTPEGRSVRDINNNTFKEEYFVKDHLGNVRSTIDVIQKPMQIYLATYELASANLEGLYFEQLNEIRDDKPGSINPNDQKSGKLNGQDRPVGTSLLMHVMAGDQVELNVNNYYDSYSPTTDNPISASSMLSSIVSTLTGGIGGFQGSEGHNPDMVQQLFQPGNYLSEYQGILDGVTDQSRPRAYLNYILFDENMQIDKSFSNAFQVNSTGSWEQIGTTTPLTIPTNGYLAVYLSNQSQGISCYDCATVHFDQLQIRLQKGRQLEESHYYPFGLPMAGLSSAAENNTIAQRRKYQSNEYIKELGLNWMDFNARQYDPQIGRFLSVDPLASSGGQDMFSPYAAMGNAPESMVDPNGTQFESPNGHREINDLWQPASNQKFPIPDMFAGGGGPGGGPNMSGSEGSVTLYGANARGFWAQHIGLRPVQGKGEIFANFTGAQNGFTSDQVIDAGWKIDGNYAQYFHAYRYIQDGDDLTTLRKETAKFLKQEEAGDDFWGEMDSWMKPVGIPLSGIEYHLGKALKVSDANDMIKKINRSAMLESYPFLKNRPVNIHIPGNVRIEIPRNVLKGIGTGLQVFGVASAIVGGFSDAGKYDRGEISGAHLAVNLVMSTVGFFGPIGAAASIVYSLSENLFWD